MLVFLLFGEKTYAQTQNVVSGRVNEIISGKKQPALGVNVVIMNNQDRFITGTTTDMNGVYRIAIPRGESEVYLHFSFIGLKSQTVKYTGQTIIDVDLEEDIQVLGEVEVIGQRVVRNDMGLTDRQILSATQRIDVSELVETMPISSIEEALQGQLGGVDIILSGDPGARSSIRIRGTSSLIGSNEPLIVIDGVPYETEIDEDFSFETANEEDFGALLNISPSDIESIEVLKDASATAIWGTEGGNGVLLITTKKGSKGKTVFTFGTKVNISEEPKRIPMLNGRQYKAMIQDAIWNTANARGLQNSSNLLELLFNTNEINYIPDWRYFNEYNQDTDWLSEVRRLAVTTDNNFAMSGRGDKATYRFSINYLNEQGTTKGTTFDRLTSMLNVSSKFSR
ncbi:MAG: TonB-dependent receptor plug domain-containing protein [Odoribacter sp.]|nr:TonB-dependent receptor plug domain-containing protein [Odoribacter sp.]